MSPAPVWRSLLLLLLTAVATLLPLVYASPPDPWWVAGWWNDSDGDDAVIGVTGVADAVIVGRAQTLHVIHAVGPRAAPAAPPAIVLAARTPSRGRAPPLA